ncbi:DUF6207 family protein [Streptomyces noursei]
MTEIGAFDGPGVVRLDIVGADDTTARAAAVRISGLWSSTGPSEPTPSGGGMRVHLYADIFRKAPPRPVRRVLRPRIRRPVAHRYRSVI